MTEYIYIASDQPLAIGDFSASILNNEDYGIDLTSNSSSFFYFREDPFDPNIRLNTQNVFSVSSRGYALPEEWTEDIDNSEKIAATILYQYILNHFKKENSKFLNILFILNNHESDHKLKKEKIRLRDLTIKDIYYSEQRLLEIIKNR